MLFPKQKCQARNIALNEAIERHPINSFRKMKPYSVISLPLLLLSNIAWSAWDAIYETKTAVHYIDQSTLEKKNEQFRHILMLQDLRNRGERGELSMQALMEYDCNLKRVRVLSATAYRGQMATGDISSKLSKPAEWIAISKESAFSTTLRYVCK